MNRDGVVALVLLVFCIGFGLESRNIPVLPFQAEAAMTARIASETLDVTAPASGVPMGHRHPLISTTEEIVDLFLGLGYSVAEGPEVEQDHYNFTALNIPEDHPARDMQDTFYLKGDKLLRTHTSPVQIRHLEQNPPPVRIVAPSGFTDAMRWMTPRRSSIRWRCSR